MSTMATTATASRIRNAAKINSGVCPSMNALSAEPTPAVPSAVAAEVPTLVTPDLAISLAASPTPRLANTDSFCSVTVPASLVVVVVVTVAAVTTGSGAASGAGSTGVSSGGVSLLATGGSSVFLNLAAAHTFGSPPASYSFLHSATVGPIACRCGRATTGVPTPPPDHPATLTH